MSGSHVPAHDLGLGHHQPGQVGVDVAVDGVHLVRLDKERVGPQRRELRRLELAEVEVRVGGEERRVVRPGHLRCAA